MAKPSSDRERTRSARVLLVEVCATLCHQRRRHDLAPVLCAAEKWRTPSAVLRLAVCAVVAQQLLAESTATSARRKMQEGLPGARALGIHVLSEVFVAQPPRHLMPPALPCLLHEWQAESNVIVLLLIPLWIWQALLVVELCCKASGGRRRGHSNSSGRACNRNAHISP